MNKGPSERSISFLTLRQSLIVLHILEDEETQTYWFCSTADLSLRCHMEIWRAVLLKAEQRKSKLLTFKRCPTSGQGCSRSVEHIFRIKKTEQCCECLYLKTRCINEQRRKDDDKQKLIQKIGQASTKDGLKIDTKTFRPICKRNIIICSECKKTGKTTTHSHTTVTNYCFF